MVSSWTESWSLMREAEEAGSSIQKFWARSGGHSYGTGSQGEEGMGVGAILHVLLTSGEAAGGQAGRHI